MTKVKDDKSEIIQAAKKCLIVAPSWVGDMVMAQVLFRELKLQSPDMEIDILAPSWCAELAQFMPEVSDSIVAKFEHGKLGLGERRRLAKSMRGKYDIAFVLPNSLKSALVPWLAKIPARIGFLGEQRYGLLNVWQKLDKTALPTMCQRFAALAKSKDDIPAFEEVLRPKFKVSMADAAKTIKTQLGEKFSESKAEKVIALFPGAEFGASKQWPSEHYATVARYFLDNDYSVLLFGSKNDAAVCSAINQKTEDRCFDLSGKTTLTEAVQLISLVDLAVSNDSGLMHVAAALGKPLVAIYGSTDPSFTPPMSLST